MSRKTIAVDFDGVVHGYTSGWTGYEPIDPPVEGAREGIERLRNAGYRVVILTTRADTPDGEAATRAWLLRHGIQVDDVTNSKVKAILYVDDRGFRFEGDWDQVLAFVTAGVEPWTKRQTEGA